MKILTNADKLFSRLSTYVYSTKSTTLSQVISQVTGKGVHYTVTTGFRFRRIIWHFQRHNKLAKLMKTNPSTASLIQVNPRLLYKYLGHYLALNLSTKDKLAMLTSHYHYFINYLRPEFFEDILHKTYIWQFHQESDCFAISLFFSSGLDWEGDLTIVLEYNKISIYAIRFIVVGSMKNSVFNQSIFVGGVQGGKDFDLIKQATKSLFDISPVALLMAALQGIALACNFNWVWGVGNDKHLAIGRACFNFDAFWNSLGGEKQLNQLYNLPVPFPEKPISSIKANHRSRTLRKREFKNRLTEQVRNHFEAQLQSPFERSMQP